MKHKVYIDGQAGTTGLQLRQKLQNHKDVEILLISEELRKDEAERKRLMNEALLTQAQPTAQIPIGYMAFLSFPLCIRKKSGMQSALPTPAAMPQALLRRFIPSFGLASSGRIIP